MVKVEKTKDLRIKTAGSEEVNTTIGGARNTSSATTKTVETKSSDDIPIRPPIMGKIKVKHIGGSIPWIGSSLNCISATVGA